MRNRDVALIAIKLLALWIIAGAAIQATELVLSWNTMRSQFASMNFGPNPPSPTSMVWSTLGAFLARALVGVAVWLMGARLTRALFPADDPHYSTGESLVLVRAASFLVGLWLLADALPLGAYMLTLGIRVGWRLEDPERAAQFASLWVKLGIGVALLRGGDWVREVILPKVKVERTDEAVE